MESGLSGVERGEWRVDCRPARGSGTPCHCSPSTVYCLLSTVRFVAGLLLLVVPLLTGCATVPRFDAGPIGVADHDLHGAYRTRTLGPLIETRRNEAGQSFVAVRPFYSRTGDAPRDRSVSDIVWPLGMVKDRKGETDWRFFPAFGHDFDADDAGSRHRWSVFPLLYGGEDINGRKYFAFFPLGGTLHEFMMRDRITFVLFPLYAYREQEDNRSFSVLWPIFSRTKGDDISRWRVFPFYGVSVSKDQWTKRFVMWPFWTSVNYHYPDQSGGGFVLFPLFGKVDVGERRSRMLLPPLFKWERGAERGGENYRALNCPWPFIQYRRGRINRTYVWPLYGRESTESERQWFALWPVVSARRTVREDHVLQRFRAVPLVYYESQTRPSGEDATLSDVFSRYFKLWPLVSYRREDENSRFRMLALWPLKQTPGIERNWAPLWSLYARERVGEATESELLWGLYRHRCDADGSRLSVFPLLQTAATKERDGDRRWSLFYGLLGYERSGTKKQFRLLYFLKFGKLPTEPADEVDPDAGDNNGVEPQ